jgi:hypothetical protein
VSLKGAVLLVLPFPGLPPTATLFAVQCCVTLFTTSYNYVNVLNATELYSYAVKMVSMVISYMLRIFYYNKRVNKYTCYAAQASVELVILPALPPECWYYRHTHQTLLTSTFSMIGLTYILHIFLSVFMLQMIGDTENINTKAWALLQGFTVEEEQTDTCIP